jgi:hypothetical protein
MARWRNGWLSREMDGQEDRKAADYRDLLPSEELGG